ncbi:hypothetical protein P879_03337, partial [Paragonimus westermani]
IATGIGSPIKTDDFVPHIIPFNKGGRLLLADCHRPANKPPASIDSDTNLLLWRQKLDLCLANMPTYLQGPYILTAAASVWNKLEELCSVPDDRVGSRTTFWNRRELLGETVEGYANQLRMLGGRTFPDALKNTEGLLLFESFLEVTRDFST